MSAAQKGPHDAVEFGRRQYPADPAQAATVREDMRGWLDTAGVSAEIAHGMLLAVSEAVDNVIVHAYPPTPDPAPEATIELTLWVDHTEVVVTVADHGVWVPPQTSALEHDTAVAPARHGRGIILMNTHVDEVAIHHDQRGTTVLLRCARERGDRASADPA